ncbi:hypothetical protein [Streptomyces sp. NBC_00316]|uniref:hypothetical protein n=1 Tax=Streptomyces sp. NBC_00316 TaxID=2975710 RepID=UPI002E2908C7|nr:hypothetical protein [Streptomyces sp. NBC_00316]
MAFTFRSAAVDQKTALPVMVVRYPADLGRDDAARPGSTLRLPVRIQRQAGSPDIPVDTLTVEASYDDGATWQPTGVRHDHAGHWSALVHHPRRAGYVSLRATATDARGNQVEQTVIHAYQLRRN